MMRYICNNAHGYLSYPEELSRADLTSLISSASVVSSRPSILRGFRREPDPPVSTPRRSQQNISASMDRLPASSTSTVVQSAPDQVSPAAAGSHVSQITGSEQNLIRQVRKTTE